MLPLDFSPDSGLRKERRKKKKITNIISFDDGDDAGAEDEDEGVSLRKSGGGHHSSEECLGPRDSSPAQNGGPEAGELGESWGLSLNGVLSHPTGGDNDEDEELDSKTGPEPEEEPAAVEQ